VSICMYLFPLRNTSSIRTLFALNNNNNRFGFVIVWISLKKRCTLYGSPTTDRFGAYFGGKTCLYSDPTRLTVVVDGEPFQVEKREMVAIPGGSFTHCFYNHTKCKGEKKCLQPPLNLQLNGLCHHLGCSLPDGTRLSMLNTDCFI
jgi:hypothetical protein